MAVERGLAAVVQPGGGTADGRAGGGAIVTVGSRTAVSGPAPLAHALSESAVVRATELLADELRPRGSG